MNLNDLHEKWMKATFTNAFVFAAILTQHKDITKQLIELFNPELHIKDIEIIEKEKHIQFSTVSKYIRLDVLAHLEDGTFVNVEMQMANDDNLPRRLRYYSSSLDIHTLPSGHLYEDLPDTILMMICCFDLFEKNLPIYTFRYSTSDNPPIYLGDGTKIIVINTKGIKDKLSLEQSHFLDYLNTSKSQDTFSLKIEDAVADLKYNDEYRDDFMRLEYELNKRYHEGIELGKQEGIELGKQEGIEEGLNRGRLEAITDNVVSLLGKGFTFEEITDLLQLDETLIPELKEKLNIE